jgi:hypothetical protein
VQQVARQNSSYVPPKRLLTYGLHCAIIPKMATFKKRIPKKKNLGRIEIEIVNYTWRVMYYGI